MAARRKRENAAADPLAEATRRYQQAEQALARLHRYEMLGRACEGVAHDLNNLLGVIGNSTDLLQQLVIEPQAGTAVAACRRAVDRASRLTGRLQAIAAGAVPGGDGAIDLSNVLADMHDLMVGILGRRIAIQLHIAADTRRVAVKRSELELALLALLLNAREAMPRGGHLWVDIRNADRAERVNSLVEDAMVSVSVSDDGSGMPDDIAASAFEAYVTTRADSGACGLGLSRVRAFCESVGGRASLACTPGLGTSVTLLLPAQPEDRADDTLSKESPQSDHESAVIDHADTEDLAGISLLLVEDNLELASVTASLLARFGLRVSHAANAEQAMRKIAAQDDVDIVLSDIVMPGGIDGVEMAHRIRQLRPRLPVVLITAYSTALGQAGEFHVLHKPCSADLLIETLKRQLAPRSRR